MADGTTFPPFQTITDLTPVATLKFTAQVWINQDGQDWRCNIGDIANLMPPHVTSFNGRTGDINLTLSDVTGAGGAPNTSPFLDGVPQAPTPPRGAADTRIATAAFVQDAIGSTVVGVASFNGRVGAVTLTTGDVTGAGGATAAQLATFLPLTGGVLAGPGNLVVQGGLTAAGGITGSSAALSGDLTIGATKSANFVWAGPASGVAAAPTWRRLSAADITGLPVGTVTSVGLTVPGDMIVTGSPVTGAGVINVTRASQAANLVLASPNGAAGIPSYRPLVAADITGGVGVTSVGVTIGGAASALLTAVGSPVTGAGNITLGFQQVANNFVLAGPTSGGPLAPTFRQLTAADISGLPTGTVTSVGLTMPGPFVVSGSPVTGSGNLTVGLQTEPANTVWAAPNGAAGAPTFRTLTTADITGLPSPIGTVTSVGLSMPSMFSVIGSPVTGSGNLTVVFQAQGASTVLAAPPGGGQPAFRQLSAADITGIPQGTVTSVGLSMPADFTVANSPITASGAINVARASQAQNLVLASPNGASGAPTYRALVGADLPNPSATTKGGVQAIAAVPHQWINAISATGVPSLTQPAAADISGLAPSATIDTTNASNINSGVLPIAQVPSLSTLYLPLGGGVVTGPLTLQGPGPSVLNLDAPAVGLRPINFTTAGVLRWRLSASGTAESGGNAGSDLNITGYNDAGGVLGNYVTINRATGAVTLATSLTTPSLTLTGNQPQNTVLAAPNGAAGAPTYRALVGADLPPAGIGVLGGVQAIGAVAHQWVRSISNAGVPVLTQPAAADLSDFVARTLWTPVITCVTPGDLSVAYSIQNGWYTKIGPLVFYTFLVAFNPTYTSASGNIQVTGLPVVPVAGQAYYGTIGQLFPATWPTAVTQAALICAGGTGIFTINGMKSAASSLIFQITNFASGAANQQIGGTGFFSTL